MTRKDPCNTQRRRFLKLGATAAVAAAGFARASSAADLPHLPENDPTAQALGYQNDTRKVPTAKYPKHQPGQQCSKCSLFQGAAGTEWGPCAIFPGKSVHASGWCSAFTAKQ